MGSQFVDLNGDGKLDYLTATFDGSPHVAWGGEGGFGAPERLVDKDGLRVIVSHYWDYEAEQHLVNGRSVGGDEEHTERCVSAHAFDWDADGQLRFSLQADLAGTSVGDVSNGDVLRLEADGSVSLIFSEEVVQVAMEAASGQSGAIGDVHGLTVVGDDTWVVVQGPSAVDGVPLRLGDVPVLATDEASLGLGGAELDGVVALDPSFRRGSLAVDADLTVPGSSIVGSGAGFEPLSAVVVVATGSQAPGFPLALGGFGELWLDHMDPVLATPVWPVVATDASGRFSQSLQLPPGQFGGTWQGSWGWSFQALDLTHLELSPPVRIEL